MFEKILVANRGEIACRIIKTARRMGIRSVAVYSDADARSRHVALADEAFRLGTAEAKDSYLRGERIIDAARRCGAQAIHPGYGFLSENADFADACGQAGVIFIGPPAAAIRAMGDKSAAKALMETSGVPVVPGYHGGNQDGAFLREQAARIGMPLLVKASAGGGGKGMRVVERLADFDAALAACRRESQAAFGDERVLLERFLARPRHIEVQVFADRHGACIHLFERDCSVQRRYQKVVEEAPAPGMSEQSRREMGAVAVAAAKAVGYVGAGTVEFIAEAADGGIAGEFYFMEMNTRIQVEHPVTEMITGVDLVEWQLRIAAGERLPLAQEGVRSRGHALEARIYAEDPGNDFLPATGRIAHLAFPAESDDVRVDSGVRAGDEITPYYDPMIAKLIARGRDRGEALERLRGALGELEVAGLATNIGFLRRLLACRAFARGELDTGLIERNRGELLAPPEPADERALALAALAALLRSARDARERARRTRDPHSPWSAADGWCLGGNGEFRIVFRERGREHAVTARHRADGYEVEISGKRNTLSGKCAADGRLAAQLGAATVIGRVVISEDRFDVFLAGEHHRLELRDPLHQDFDDEVHAGEFTAPMPGKVAAVLVRPGARVERGAPLLVLEAMKMEHTIAAPSRGVVAAIYFAVGEQVAEGDELLDFEADAAAS